ncbi:sensor histidine kinase [Streptosporangium carneum]|nr:histidine kinase [Streptosporangium carneum]
MRGKAKPLTVALLWASLGIPVLWAGFTSQLTYRLEWWEILAYLVVIGVGVALSRARPLAAMLLGSALWLAGVVRGNPFGGFAAMAVLAYLAGVRMERARPAVIGLGVLLGLAGAVPPLIRDAGAGFVAVAGVVLAAIVPWLSGRARRQYLVMAREGWERAEELERAQRVIAEQARTRERTRIAGDMHDLLGHELGLVALRIGGLEVAPGLDERYREAAGEARRAVTSASKRLQEIVDMLHQDTVPSQESVPELVERARAAGMRVESRTLGQGPPPTAMAERALRRVVQEGLTNSAKHAPGAPVTVTVEHLDSESVVTVTTGAVTAGAVTADAVSRRAHGDGRGREGAAGQGGGYGLEGLGERVRLCGGSLRAGPRGEGFEMSARLPRVPGPIAEPSPPSVSAAHLARAQRRARRTRVTAIVTAVTAGTAVTVVVAAFMVYDAATSVLPPAVFQGLRVGQQQAAVERVLPGRTRIDGPVPGEPPRQPGTSCRYYGTHPNPFDETHRELFRLCFMEGRLVSKDFLPADRVP